jgi:tRNA pseudouridine55 synthase
VLVVALGRATRLLPYLPMEPKRYRATIAFGAETDTLDAAGTVVATADAGHVDEAAVRAALARFTGPLRQVPPMVSAVKVQGERLYAKARRGETVERAARPVTVHALELLAFRPAGDHPPGDGGPATPAPLAEVAVTCSGGTYVRVLAADLGRALGTLAHLTALRRTAAGVFDVDHAVPLAELEAAGRDGLAAAVLDPARALAPLGLRPLRADEAAALASGRPLAPSGRPGPLAAVAPDGRLVAVIQDRDGCARPRVVLA